MLPKIPETLANWLMRLAESPNVRATTLVASPRASDFAIFRFRYGSDLNQAATSIRAAAISAGPACRFSTRTSPLRQLFVELVEALQCDTLLRSPDRRQCLDR